MVTASLVHEHAQNMNYAVKFQLLSALLASAGISLESISDSSSAMPLTTPQLSKQSRSALWLVGCQG